MKIAGRFPSTRLRRVRKKGWIRRLISENNLSTDDLILPVFVRDGKNKVDPIRSMPGVNRYSLDKINIIMKSAQKYKIPMIALFPYIEKNKKDKLGRESLNKNNLICKSIRLIKKRYPKIGIMCEFTVS